MKQPTVQDLMRDERQMIVGPDLPVREAACRLLQSDCDLLVVIHPDGRLAGIVSESSLVRVLLSSPREQQAIEPLVVNHVESVRSTSPLASVMPLFRAACHTALPVVDENDHVCGLLFRRDAVCVMLGQTLPEASSSTGHSPVDSPADSRTIQSPDGTRTRMDSASPSPSQSGAEHPNARPESGNVSGSEHSSLGHDSAAASADSGHSAARPSGDNELQSNSNARGKSETQENARSGPYFLRGRDARRRLRLADPGDSGLSDGPW